jgi:hypothetical protein
MSSSGKKKGDIVKCRPSKHYFLILGDLVPVSYNKVVKVFNLSNNAETWEHSEALNAEYELVSRQSD